MVKCCKKILCFECITMVIANNPKCPHCRHDLTNNELVVIRNAGEEQEEQEEQVEIEEQIVNYHDIVSQSTECSKEENFAKIMEWIVKTRDSGDDKKTKLLIFSEYSATFDKKYTDVLDKYDMKYTPLKGAITTVKNIIRQYKEENIDVLFLNSHYFGSGVNLENTTDIMIVHKMSPELENQVIGRAQRVGRVNPLNVWKLYYHHETI